MSGKGAGRRGNNDVPFSKRLQSELEEEREDFSDGEKREKKSRKEPTLSPKKNRASHVDNKKSTPTTTTSISSTKRVKVTKSPDLQPTQPGDPYTLSYNKSKKFIKMPGLANAANLLFRGMSPQNILNLKKNKKGEEDKEYEEVPIFRAQNPKGKASIHKHVASDDHDSPYISFEIGMGVSVAKYAPKPVINKNGRKKILGVEEKDGYLKMPKSYSGKNQEKSANLEHIGYVAGVHKKEEFKPVDISTKELASIHVQGAMMINRAIADAEVLLEPGEDGISKQDTPVIQKVKKVNEDYYKRHSKSQTKKKALAAFKPAKAEKPNYYKVQISDKYTDKDKYYYTEFPSDVEGSDSAMSSIESIDMDEFMK